MPPALWPVQSRACVRCPGRLTTLCIPGFIITKAISIHACTKYTPNLYLNVLCTRPLRLLYISLNLVFTLPWRRPGRLHMLGPHSGPVSPLYVTLLSLIPYVNTTGPLARTKPCMCEASWMPRHSLHPKFDNNQSNIHPRVHYIYH